MEKFNAICAEYSWLVTAISIILSALISWAITVAYFRKDNKILAQLSIIQPMYELTKNPFCSLNYNELNILANNYAIKFLSKKSKDSIAELIRCTSQIYGYNQDKLYAESVIELYLNKLKENDVNIYIEPISDDIDIDEKQIPSRILDFEQYIESLFKKEYFLQHENNAENLLNSILNKNAKDLFNLENPIDFFGTKTYIEVLNTTNKMQKWSKKFKRYKDSVNNFVAVNKIKENRNKV